MRRFVLVSLAGALLFAVLWRWSQTPATTSVAPAPESEQFTQRYVNEQLKAEDKSVVELNSSANVENRQVSVRPSLEVTKKLQVLEEILKSKNDNDPRLDTEFKNLSPEMKKALESQYEKRPEEDRNGRGTIAFLVAREISGPEDLEFLSSVLREEPCLSLADCKQTNPSEKDAHLGGVDDLTMNYPQIVVLNQIEKWLGEPKSSQLDSQMLQTVEATLNAALASSVPMISEKAESLLKRIHRR